MEKFVKVGFSFLVKIVKVGYEIEDRGWIRSLWVIEIWDARGTERVVQSKIPDNVI